MATRDHRPSTGALSLIERLGPHKRRRHRATHTRGLPLLIALGAVVMAVAAVAGWNLSGGRLLVMQTPSMCPEICVGSLVADRPLLGAVYPGELVTFHVPDNDTETYTHEISRIFANGAIQTRGVANAQHDPWLLTRSDIVGEVVFSVWELGWLLKALPLLAVGVLLWVTARPLIGERARRSWDRGWMTILTVLPLWLLHPFVSGTVVSTTLGVVHHRHWASDVVLNTGVIPVSLHAAGGQGVLVSSTDLGHVAGPLKHGYLMLQETASLRWWGLVLVALVVISPLAGCLWHILRGDEAGQEAEPGRRGASATAMLPQRAPLARPV